MSKFKITKEMQAAIDALEAASYSVKFGDKLFQNGTKTFQIYRDGDKKHGCSSTSMLTLHFVVNQVIISDAIKNGKEWGTKKLQKQLRDLLDV